VYDNGMEKRADNGHLIKGPDGTLITRENSTVLLRKRWEKYRLASNRRIVREAAAIDPTIKAPSEAFALVASKQFVALMDYDKPRIDELEKLEYIMTGYDPKQSASTDGPASAERAAAMNMTTAMLLERVWSDVMKAKQADVVDGTVHDAE
jgi:hypothetical protein